MQNEVHISANICIFLHISANYIYYDIVHIYAYYEYICICDKLCFCREAFGDSEDDERSDVEPQALPSPENSPPPEDLPEQRPRKRAFGRANSALVFQEAQLMDMHSVPFLHLLYGDKSFSGAHWGHYPIYSTC